VGRAASLIRFPGGARMNLTVFRFDPRKRGPSQVEKLFATHLDGRA
jgi:hypothetical protein